MTGGVHPQPTQPGRPPPPPSPPGPPPGPRMSPPGNPPPPRCVRVCVCAWGVRRGRCARAPCAFRQGSQTHPPALLLERREIGEREIFVCFGFSLDSLLTRSFSPSFGVLQKLSQGRSPRRAEGEPDHGDEAPCLWVHVPAPPLRACPPPSRDREAGTTSQANLVQPNKPLPTSEHFARRPPLAPADSGPALPPFCPSLVEHILISLTRLRILQFEQPTDGAGGRGVSSAAQATRAALP